MACVQRPADDTPLMVTVEEPIRSCHWVAEDLCSACDGESPGAGLMWEAPPRQITTAYWQGLVDAAKVLGGEATWEELHPLGVAFTATT
jgi:hypothetical protein